MVPCNDTTSTHFVRVEISSVALSWCAVSITHHSKHLLAASGISQSGRRARTFTARAKREKLASAV